MKADRSLGVLVIFMWKIQFQHSDVETNVHCIPIFCIKFFFLFSQLFVVSEHFLDVVSPVQVKDEHSWEKIHTSISYSRYTFLFQFVADPPEGDSD